MEVLFQKPRVGGRLSAIPAKSEVHRVLIAAALADTGTSLRLSGTGDDIEATVASLEALGASVTRMGDTVTVKPIRSHRVSGIPTLPVGESGSTLRFLLPVALALYPDGVRFRMKGRLPRRPLSPLKELLEEKGISFVWEDDRTLFARGTLLSGDYAIAADVSSQFISGLLFALPLLSGRSTLSLTGRIESAPYIDMTRDALSLFSVAISPDKDTCLPRSFVIEEKTPAYSAPRGILSVGGDYSNAAFPLVMGALSEHSVTVTGLMPDTRQGDSQIVEILSRFGAKVERNGSEVRVKRAPLSAIDIDASQIPDLVPILAVLATQAAGTTRFLHAERLRLKESDRIQSTLDMLRALSAEVNETADGLTVTGKTPLTGGKLDAAGDHRIAMCAAVLSTVAEGDVTLSGGEAVSKSYPHFYRDLQSLLQGGKLILQEQKENTLL